MFYLLYVLNLIMVLIQDFTARVYEFSLCDSTKNCGFVFWLHESLGNPRKILKSASGSANKIHMLYSFQLLSLRQFEMLTHIIVANIEMNANFSAMIHRRQTGIIIERLPSLWRMLVDNWPYYYSRYIES